MSSRWDAAVGRIHLRRVTGVSPYGILTTSRSSLVWVSPRRAIGSFSI